MTESVRQRKKIDESNVQSLDDDDDVKRRITIDRYDHENRNQSSITLSQISLGIIAVLMIVLLVFIKFGLPHEDHMTK
ncbi:unnamed protein product, partial [Rotaria magnacalcarata]